jgi:imidazolonepropionase-like amidohydrolase
VRRQRGKTVLFVKDLTSGHERPVYDGLERDMQETWSIHGVYPSMAWTPDNRAIVLWAAEDPARRTSSPDRRRRSRFTFRARARWPRRSGSRGRSRRRGSRFEMLRWVEVSPRGDQVAYEALGRIWVRDLPAARRGVSPQADGPLRALSLLFEGRQVDRLHDLGRRESGSVRVVPSRGGEEKVLTPEPGHYREPAFSPDGSKVVFRKDTGGGLVTTDWGLEPGLYSIPAGGGKPSLVTRDGVAPQFGAANDRVYFTRFDGGDDKEEAKRTFASAALDGADLREHLQSTDATEFRISPDEKWIAFRERFNAYVAPFVRTGTRVDIGPKSKAIPVAKVSKDAGEYLRWAGDGRSLHWALGRELFTRSLTDSFAFLAGAPEKLPDVPEKGTDIGFEASADLPKGTVALVGGRVVTMKGDEIFENGTVVVEGNRIRAVGPAEQVSVPAGARVVDVKGKTVLPGFIDVHWHGAMGNDWIVPQQNWDTDATLAFGVTTLHDPSHDTEEIFAASEMARAGLLRAPRIYSTGTILYGAAGDFKAEIDSLDDARAHLKRMKAVGAISVKSYNQPRREQRQQILAAARETQMMVVPEGGSLFELNMTMVVDGHTGIEHSIPVAHAYKDVVELWPADGVGYTPTLIVGYGGLFGETYWYQHTNVWENEKLSKFVPPFVLDPRSRRRLMAPEDDFNHVNNAKIAKRLFDAGVSIQVGAHGQREGLGAHWEMWMLVQGGMTPREALACATRNGAAYLGMGKDLGSLEVGKLADVVVIDGDPTADIRQSEKVRYTMVNGRLYDANTLEEVGSTAKRPKYWWQR